MPKPIWIVTWCAAKNSTFCAVVTSGRGGGMVLARAKKIDPEGGVERRHDREHDPDVALAGGGGWQICCRRTGLR